MVLKRLGSSDVRDWRRSGSNHLSQVLIVMLIEKGGYQIDDQKHQ